MSDRDSLCDSSSPDSQRHDHSPYPRHEVEGSMSESSSSQQYCTAFDGGFSRREKRYLRHQILNAIKKANRETAVEMALEWVRNQKTKTVFHKETQTEAYAIMDMDLFVPAPAVSSLVPEVKNLAVNPDQYSEALTTVMAHHLPRKYKKVNQSSPPKMHMESEISSELTPCLQGNCQFAEELNSNSDVVWVGCKYVHNKQPCKYWVHAKCLGFPKMTKEVAKLAKGYKCPEHLF